MMAGAVAVATLVLLAGGLSGHAKPRGNLWPPDAQADGMVDQHRELCLCLPLRDPGAPDQFQHLGRGHPGIRASGRAGTGFSTRRWCCGPGSAFLALAGDRRLDLLT